jgi:hypothetical protein
MNKREVLKQFESGGKAWPYPKNGKDASNGIYFSFDPKENIIEERTIRALEKDGKIKSVQVFTVGRRDNADFDEVIDVRYYYVLASADVPEQETRYASSIGSEGNVNVKETTVGPHYREPLKWGDEILDETNDNFATARAISIDIEQQ